MAVIRVKEFTIDLGEVVKARLDSFIDSRKRIRAVKDAEFQRRVIDEGLTFGQQLSYYESQLKTESARSYRNIGFITDLKKEITDFKKLIRYERLKTLYLENYTEWKEGRLGVDNFIRFIEKSITETKDLDTQKELEVELSKIKIAKAESEKIILNNKVILAQQDKSVDLINKILGEVNDRRSEALLVGDRETVSALDVKIQTLESRRQEIMIEDKVHDFEISIFKGGLNASQKLNLLETAIGAADNDTPVIIDRVRWGSELSYWTAQKNAYLAGMGTGEFTDFFNEFSEEIQARTKELSLTNAFGYVPISFIDSIEKDYKTLATKEGFEVFIDKIESSRLSDISNAIDYVAGAILDESAILGDYEKAQQNFLNIQTKFNVDMTTYLGELYISKITTLPSKAEAIRATAKTKAEAILGVEFDELNLEHQTLYEKVVQELLKSPLGIEPGILEKITEEFAPKPKAEAPKVKPSEQTYEVKGGESLSKIASQYGMSWQELHKANPQITDPNVITPGQVLTIPSGEVKKEVSPVETKPLLKEPEFKPQPKTKLQPESKPTPTIMLTSEEEKASKQAGKVSIGTILYPSWDWYDINIVKKGKTAIGGKEILR